MELYIKVINGNPINHPILASNLIDALGIDYDNIPKEYEKFKRKECNIEIGLLEKPISRYEKIDGVWTDVWESVPLAENELQFKKNQIKDEKKFLALAHKNYAEESLNLTSNNSIKQYLSNYISTISDLEINYDTIIPDPPFLNVAKTLILKY